MRTRMTLVGLLTLGVTFAATTEVAAAWRIGDNAGGAVGRYVQDFASMRDSGEAVMIDGACLSACTLVLAFIPRDRICVTSRALLGFHTAWTPDAAGRPVPSQWGTQTLVALYPTWIRQWIARAGGLSERVLYLGGRELTTMLSACR